MTQPGRSSRCQPSCMTQTACPLRARSAGQRREITVTYDKPGTAADLRTGRLTRCANRPSNKQRVAPEKRVAVWVAVRGRAVPPKEDRPTALIQLEPIRTAVPRAANTVGACADPTSRRGARPALCLESPDDRQKAALAAAVPRPPERHALAARSHSVRGRRRLPHQPRRAAAALPLPTGPRRHRHGLWSPRLMTRSSERSGDHVAAPSTREVPPGLVPGRVEPRSSAVPRLNLSGRAQCSYGQSGRVRSAPNLRARLPSLASTDSPRQA